MKRVIFYTIIIFNLNLACVSKPKVSLDKEAVVLSSIKGAKSKVDTLKITNNSHTLNNLDVLIEGLQSDYFKILTVIPKKLDVNKTFSLLIEFQPDINFVGLANAQLVIKCKDNYLIQCVIKIFGT